MASAPVPSRAALRQLPGANLAVVSVPGAHAALEATTALRQGLHVFLFSDNVAVEDEIALKRLAASRGLLCMGPDCGTAYLNGVGLGFANVVPRGRIGCVAASGTGLQAVASHVAALGEGISHGIGVGGRDLSAAVGGLMTRLALERLAADSRSTEVIAVISKPPAPAVMAELDALIRTIAKPVVVCCLGAGADGAAAGHRVDTLEGAAATAVALARGRPVDVPAFGDPAAVRAGLARLGPDAGRPGPALHGALHRGHARPRGEPAPGPTSSARSAGDGAHRVLDLGADEHTVGRPHPMIDPSERAARIRALPPEVGVLLVDVVLGRAAHADPARPVAAAVRAARAAAARGGRSLAVIASVVGTDADPQGRSTQTATLEAAGVEVLPSNAQACRFAALLLRPDLAPRLLPEAP